MELSELPQEQLKQARLQANWSVEEVAEALNLPARSITLLEAGKFSSLHGSIYAISYIKAYATLFSLDAKALVAAYQKLGEVQPLSHSINAQNSPIVILNDMHNPVLISIATALLLLVVVVGSWLAPEKESMVGYTHQLHVETIAGTMVIESVDSLPNKNPTADILPIVSAAMVSAAVDKQALIKSRVFEGANTDNLDAQVVSSVLNFQFSADCWVEVVDGNNQKLYASLQKAQENLQLSGKPPFRITLGYAPGVSLSYNGQPVDIDAKKAKLTKLILGKS